MKTIWKTPVIAGLVALVLSISGAHGVSAIALDRTIYSQTAVSSTVEPVTIAQMGDGSFFATLQWTPVAKATEYRIYKTSTIRPGWRLFAYVSPSLAAWTVSDKPGIVAAYRLVAVVNNREVLIGRVTYFPKR